MDGDFVRRDQKKKWLLERRDGGSTVYSLTIYTLRMISIKFRLAISMLCKIVKREVIRITDIITQDEFA